MQFTTRSLFVLMTLAAGLAWVFLTPPQWVGIVVLYLMYLLMPATILAGIIYHRGSWQAFFIGCAPCASVITLMVWFGLFDGLRRFNWDDLFGSSSASAEELILHKAFVATPLAVVALGGAAAAGIRAWAVSIQQRQAGRSPPNTPTAAT